MAKTKEKKGMTVEEMEALFEEFVDDHHGHTFNDITAGRKLSPRPDLHAMMLLDNLSPSTYGEGALATAEHDQVWFDFDETTVARNATREDVLDLVRCGVCYTINDGFWMFV